MVNHMFRSVPVEIQRKMESLNSRNSQMRAAFCMGFVFICVGIPLWWKTTEVYRADLPYSEIQSLLDDAVLTMKIGVQIVYPSQKWSESTFSAFKNDKSKQNLDFIAVEYDFKCSEANSDEFETLKSDSPNNNILMLMIPSNDAKTPEFTVSRNRKIFVNIPIDYSAEDFGNFPSVVKDFLSEDIVNTKAMNDAISKAYGTELRISKDREFHLRKTVQPDKGYDLLFSLLCPEPDKIQATWDVQEATNMYLSPLLEKLNGFADFYIGSQILYYSGLSVKPKKSKDKDTNYYLTHQQLPHVVNPIESRLGAQMSPNPTLNFVIYVAEEKYTPLKIQRADGSYSSTNTFLIPRWGAVIIKNIAGASNSTEIPYKVKLDGLEFMEIFVAQLRSLLGIETSRNTNRIPVVFEEPGGSGITDLELDYLIRTRVAENIATAVHTLHSLSALLEKIQNIVINDKIASHVFSAVREIRKAKDSLVKSNLSAALSHSNTAFKSSEIAFFDPTLLELLYFPEDQKFAIYIPLFLPISLPLIGSLFNAFKLYKSEKKKLKSE